MKKFKVYGDDSNNINTSARIIIDSLNAAAKKIELYDENGAQVCYSVLGTDFGKKCDVLISVYETITPYLILENFCGRPVLGVSRDNQDFIVAGGYPREKTGYFSLGVLSDFWRKISIDKDDKFRFLAAGDSNSRSGYETLIPTFAETFKNNDKVELYIKDRNCTYLFRDYVKEYSKDYNVSIVLDGRDLYDKGEERKVYSWANALVAPWHSTTFGMTIVQSMAMSLPVISLSYSGMRDYLNNYNSLLVKYKLENITLPKLQKLINSGFRNYLFPPNPGVYPTVPQWAEMDKEDLSIKMKSLYENPKLCDSLALNARKTAETLTWEASALSLSQELDRLL